MTRRRWGRAATAGVGVTGVFIVILAAEAALLALGRFPPRTPKHPGQEEPHVGPQVNPAVGWTLVPQRGWVDSAPEFQVLLQADALGFRQGARPRRAGPPIAFLGDSFTFGTGVEYAEAFPALVAAALGVPELNLGMSGFGVDQMWRTYSAFARRAAPAWVILTYVDDDLYRSMSAYRWRGGWWAKPAYRVHNGVLLPRSPADAPTPPIRWIVEHSRLLEAWRTLAWARSLRRARGDPWRLNALILEALKRDAAADGVRFLVVRLPQKGQDQPSAATAADLAAREVPFLDLAVHAGTSSEMSARFFARDPHLNRNGHRWVADVLVRELVTRGWFPARGGGAGGSSAAQPPAPSGDRTANGARVR